MSLVQKPEFESYSAFLHRLSLKVDSEMGIGGGRKTLDPEVDYLRTPAPNIIEWITGIDYWNVPTTFDHSRQYQIIRDVFNLRCPICNSNKPEDVDCWGKSRLYLESEVLLVWSEAYQDFVCPKCGSTQRELVTDGIFSPYNEMVVIAGMRSGKSFTGAHIGGYFEHFLITRGMRGPGYLQRMLKQEKSEWFEVTFAASTATQALQTIYVKYREMRNGSPWLRRYMEWVRNQEDLQVGGGPDRWSYKMLDDSILDGFLKVRFNRIASDSAGVAGKTRIMASIDEWARLVDTEGTRSAMELYRVLNQSLKTVRASQELNNLPLFLGLMLNVTSPLAQDDPAMQLYVKAQEGELKRVYSWKGATWEFNPQMPRHIFDEEFVKDPLGAERDFGANPPNADSPFVDDPLRFWKSIDWSRKPIADFMETYLTDETDKQYVGLDLISCGLDHVNTYYLFGDAGLSWDAFGLVCAHPEWISTDTLQEEIDEDGNKRPLFIPPAAGRISPVDDFDVVFAEDVGTYMGADIPMGGDTQIIKASLENRRRSLMSFQSNSKISYDHQGEMLCTVIDFAIRIVPTVERDIWFNSVVRIVEQLRKQIRVAAIAFDRWNSESTIQQIRTMGLMASKVMLRPEHFMSFLRMAYNGRIKLLAPEVKDLVGISDHGNLVLGTPQEQMAGQSVALVELLKLSRSADLRKFHNLNKGKVRGRDSDDLARCCIGVHYLVQNSVVDELAETKRRRAIRKRQVATESTMFEQIFKSDKPF